MLFGRVRVFTILQSILLVIWNFFGVSGLVLAQSLLSDRIWLEQKINVFIEKDLTEQNRYARFSGIIHAPLILNHSFARPLAPEKQELLYPIELSPKPSLSQIQKYDLTNESSISHLSLKLKIRLSNHPFEFAKEKVLAVILLDIIIPVFQVRVAWRRND